jgi:hypothetical protein
MHIVLLAYSQIKEVLKAERMYGVVLVAQANIHII